MSTLRVEVVDPTSNTVELALWYDGLIYECELNPTQDNTDYECSSFETSLSNVTNDEYAALRVINDDTDGVWFDEIKMITSSKNQRKKLIFVGENENK